MNPATRLILLTPQFIGQNVVTNGGFDADTAWTKEVGWSIGSGVATSIGGSSTLYQLPSITGKIMRVAFTITAQSGDCRVRLRCGSGYTSGAYSAVGSYSITVPSAATTDLFGFYGDGTTGSISIDNIVALAHR